MRAKKIKGGLGDLVKPRGGRPQAKRLSQVAALPEAVNDHTAKHGDYVRDGNRGMKNRGGTPIARWTRDGLLSETQTQAIDFCIGLWERAGRFNGLVQDLTKIVGQQPSSGLAQQEALDRLSAIKGYIPSRYYQVFENVCRFDEPAGTAGSSLATNSRSAIDAARLCVSFVADVIHQRERL